jgi:hypothetical protein
MDNKKMEGIMKTIVLVIGLLASFTSYAEPFDIDQEIAKAIALTRAVSRGEYDNKPLPPEYYRSYRSYPSYPSYIDRTPSEPINYWPQSQSINIRGDRYHCNSFPGLTRTITYCN